MSRDHSQSDTLPNHSCVSEDEEKDGDLTTENEQRKQKTREECTVDTTGLGVFFCLKLNEPL